MKEIGKLGPRLGLDEEAARIAAEKALGHYDLFRHECLEQTKEVLETLGEEPTVILAGRPYTVCSSEVNLSLPRKIVSRGYHVVPADMLPQLDEASPPRDVWHFTQQISNAVAHVRESRNLYLCLLSCFSCGPDSSMYHFFRQRLAGQTFCYLEIDSHTAHAGFETRLGAFLDIIEERHRRSGKRPKEEAPHHVEREAIRPEGRTQARLSEGLDFIMTVRASGWNTTIQGSFMSGQRPTAHTL